jgi:hypothetical protein
MARMRDRFHDQPETLPLDGDAIVEPTPRFDPSQHRAFGSVPGLIGKDLDVPRFEQLSPWAWEHTDADIVAQGLYRDTARFSVDGIVLSPELYEQVIRNQSAFLASIGGKTLVANRLSNPERAKEKFDKSQIASLESKQARHETIITQLAADEERLATLQEWKRTPGYWKTSEGQMRLMATTAWDQTFIGMLRTLKDNYDLSNEQFIDMQHALAYRLFKGPQTERIEQWGNYLQLGREYTHNCKTLFQQSDSRIKKALQKER